MAVLESGKQEKFLRCILDGMSQRKAYREAFDSETDNDAVVDVSASQLFNDPKVSIRWKELQEQTNSPLIMTVKRRKEKLSNMGENSEREDIQIKAIDTLNKMDGIYVNKTELSGNVGTLSLEEKREIAEKQLAELRANEGRAKASN